MKIVFMGSPDFGVPSLRALNTNFDVVGVISQPDRPAGRGRQLKFSSVKETALELDLPMFQPEQIDSENTLQTLQAWQPDLIVVAAYGQILPSWLLEYPKYGCINVHASLLPRWRGAAPIQAAILHGDDMTGVTIMLMDAGLDTGPILSQQSVPIMPDETGGELFERLAPLGAELLTQTIPAYRSKTLKPVPQNPNLATYAPSLSKKDGHLDFNESANKLARQIRAYHPWPGSHFFWDDRRHLVHKAEAVETSTSIQPGTPFILDSFPAVQCGEGALVLRKLQPAGKQVMSADDFLNGAQGFLNSHLLASNTTRDR